MAANSFAGPSNTKLFFLHSSFKQTRCAGMVKPYKAKDSPLENLHGLRGTPGRYSQVSAVSCDSQRWRSANSLVVLCASSTTNSESGQSEGKQSHSEFLMSGSPEVESLIHAICDTSSIAEFELKLASFRLYVKRDLNEKNATVPASSVPFVQHYPSIHNPDLNGSASTTSLAISKPDPSSGSIHGFVDSSSDEGLAILQSPKVGFFRRSRTIKGKRGPPPCKEKQEVKEGQVLCYIEQLGGEIPIESDVSGEVVKILREDGEPVGYGDGLMTILPSFPGIKKL